jgi:hypothetical protein
MGAQMAAAAAALGATPSTHASCSSSGGVAASTAAPAGLSHAATAGQAQQQQQQQQWRSYSALPARQQQQQQPWRTQQQQQQQQRRGMFIQTQPTPNPQSLMFVPGRQVMESGSYEFANARAAMGSPLAKRLFAIDGVTSVFFGSDFVTVTKADDAAWPVLKPLVFAAIMDHYGAGEPLFTDAATLAAADTAIHPDDDEVGCGGVVFGSDRVGVGLLACCCPQTWRRQPPCEALHTKPTNNTPNNKQKGRRHDQGAARDAHPPRGAGGRRRHRVPRL